MLEKTRLSTTIHCTRKSTRYNSSAEAISLVSISTSRKPISRSSMETCWNNGVRRTKKTANRALPHCQHRSLSLSESLSSLAIDSPRIRRRATSVVTMNAIGRRRISTRCAIETGVYSKRISVSPPEAVTFLTHCVRGLRRAWKNPLPMSSRLLAIR